MRYNHLRAMLMAGAAAAVIAPAAAYAQAAETPVAFDIPAQSLGAALAQFAQQSEREILFPSELTRSYRAPALHGEMEPSQALRLLLAQSGLTFRTTGTGSLIVEAAQDPQGGSAGNAVQALIVTAQKREEDIQDVPIAISAFSQEDLTRSQVAGGPDLMTQVPNMTFTKTNFSSYSIQLRGIGTQAISATVDPAVAVAFNNTPFIRNRFFEQEFYDLQRVEVLRGPQGTLYGRNATAGVVNLISAKPKFYYEAKAAADIANYQSSRIEGMVNVPLVEDVVALRIAGAWTKRDGYAVNEVTGKPIDGRDLWSTRVSLRFAPNDAIDANLVWEHFEEDDDRIRSGKQLCDTDIVTEAAGIAAPDYYQPLANWGQSSSFVNTQSVFSQGCLPSSLYSPDSFQKANALALPYYAPLGVLGLPIVYVGGGNSGEPADPYASRTQSHDLRVIEAAVDPGYRAKTDVVELQFNVDLTDKLTLSSETAWGTDYIFSTQDYNRFASAPGAWSMNAASNWYTRGIINADGEFCDPQIGCSDRLVAMDLSTAKSSQFSQELRLASDFDGAFNFSLGANFLRYDTEDKYYVFINSISMESAYWLRNNQSSPTDGPYIPGVTDNYSCLPYGFRGPDFYQVNPIVNCTYIDPNPIENLNDLGHNYFLSKNPYKLISYAVFGEAYYNLAENLKVTAGLRWTVDKKEAPRIPSWLFAAVTAGYPVLDVIEQEWREPTGRLAIDWKPDLAFTDDTMVYASYSHGYKAGGMNPPPYGKTLYGIPYGSPSSDLSDALARSSALQPTTFEPEFVNAFELGAKNTLLDGALTLNLAGFYYDYKGYQLSQIVNRSAVTYNFDADIWGIELESDWRPVENFRLGLKLGYEKTKVADGMQAIDVMDRTAGHDGWLVTRPFPTLASNCVLPEWLFLGNTSDPGNPDLVDLGGKGGGNPGGCEFAYLLGNDPATGSPYIFNPSSNGVTRGVAGLRTGVDYASWSKNRDDYPCLPAGADPATMTVYPGVDPTCLIAASNNGEGFYKDLAGNELPNAPRMTATLTADYTIPLPNSWLATLHTDLYYQSEAWTRIFNTEGYDKLKAYTNVNLAAIFTNEEQGWKVMAYVKNVFDRDSITGAFLNSDDSGLTTNIFLTEPRLYGVKVTKEFDGGPWWTGANPDHKGPFPLTVELGGQVQRQDAPYQPFAPPSFANVSDGLRTIDDVQNQDLDWGDGRSLRLVYRPDGSAWSVAAGVRYGRTNGGIHRQHTDVAYSTENCAFGPNAYVPFVPVGYIANAFCNPTSPKYSANAAHYIAPTFSDVSARDDEDHQVIDFAVGHDVGLGSALSRSHVSAGLRYASFESTTEFTGRALDNWYLPPGWAYLQSTVDESQAELRAAREFKGTGPTISWDASVALLGNDQTGHLDIDWSLTAGVLFGDQDTTVVGSDVFRNAGVVIGNSGLQLPLDTVGTPTTTTFDEARSKSVTVPLLDLSLGLSYEVGRVKVGTGYRWERYFDVLDVGFDAAKDADRTIDGPYFKLAIGFGG